MTAGTPAPRFKSGHRRLDARFALTPYWPFSFPRDAGSVGCDVNNSDHAVRLWELFLNPFIRADGGQVAGYNGAFTDINLIFADPNPAGTSGTLNFTDDFTLTGAPPAGNRYYRVRLN